MGALQTTLNGLVEGLPLCMLALSFALVYLPTGVFHVALGALYVIAPLVVASLRAAGLPWAIALPVAIVVSTILSLTCDLVGHRRLARRSLSPTAHVICSLGLYMILVHTASIVWGDQTHVLSGAVDASWAFNSVLITGTQIIASIVSLACLAGCMLFLRLTGTGLRFRAMAANAREASLRGINVPRLRMQAFAISGTLAGLAGIVSSLNKGVSPQSGGLTALTLGIVAFIIGGRYAFAGALPGALCVGLARAWAEYLTSSQWMNAVSYCLLLAFLLVRPEGILGRKGRIEEQT